MASVRATTTGTNTGGASVSVTRPTGTANGDVMVAFIASDSGTAPGLPTGFRILLKHEHNTTNGIKFKVGYKVASSEPASYTFTQGASSDAVATVTAVQNAVPFFTWSMDTRANATALVAPTLTWFSSNDLLLCGAAVDGSGSAITWTPPTNMTEQADANSTGFTSASVASLIGANLSNPTGSKSFTASAGGSNGAITWSLIIADSAAVTTGIQQIAQVVSLHDIAAATTTAAPLQSPTLIATNNYLIARLALDNTGTSGVATTLSVTDPRSNTWTVLTAGNQTAGAANDGTTCYVAYAKVTTPYQAADSLTFNYGNSTTANSIVVEEWTGIDLTTPVAVSSTTANGSSTTPSISQTPTAAGQLFYGALSVEGPQGDAFTQDADTTDGVWSGLPRVASISGTAASNQCTVGGRKLVTGTTAQTWNPTLGTSRDWAQVALVFAPIVTDVNVAVTQATATGVANDVTVTTAVSVPVTEATGTGVAHNPTVTTAVGIPVVEAIATGVANNVDVTRSEDATVQTATATGAAFDVAITTSESAAVAASTATGAAFDVTITTAVSVPVDPALATGAAHDVVVMTAVIVDVIEAIGTGQALDVDVSTNESANVVEATATGQAFDVVFSESRDVDVDPALAIGTAFDVVATTATLTNVPVVEATATGAALDATVTTSESATVQTADASGAAGDVTVTVSESAQPQTATGIGQAFDVVVTTVVMVDPQTATGIGTAFDVTVTSEAATNVDVVEVLATGQAFDVTVTTSESATVDVEAATGTGDALDVVVTTGNDAAVQVVPALASGAALDVTVVGSASVPVDTALATGQAFDVTVVSADEQLVLVGIALASGEAYDVTITGGLPSGRIRIHGREPRHNALGREPRHDADAVLEPAHSLVGYASYEPRRVVEGREPRSSV
jgi:hypothetical protein